MTGTRSCIDEAALFVAAQDGAVDRIRAAHRPRPDGRCRACGAATRWPCVQVVIADRAEQIRTGGWPSPAPRACVQPGETRVRRIDDCS